MREYKADNIVVDPVMVATSGSSLMKSGAALALQEELFPLAAQKSLEESVKAAKDYVTGAIASGLNLGKGNGPLNHMWRDSPGR